MPLERMFKMITLSHVNKTYNPGKKDEIPVLSDVNAVFPQKGMIALCGKSGSGKTTLLNVIGGLISIDSGEILVDEKVVDDWAYIQVEKTGYIFQNYYLFDNRTVYDNVADSLRLCGITDETLIKKQVDDVLKNIGIIKYANRLPSFLSGGQQQRVAFARAIVKKPDILLADEPTGNLDDQNTKIIMNLLHEYSKEHLVILVTHDISLVNDYCEGYYKITDGEISGFIDNQPGFGSDSCIRTIGKDIIVGKQKKSGNLFGFVDSFVNGVKHSFSKAYGSKALCWCLFSLSVLFVVLTAVLGLGVRELIEAKTINGNNPYIFYGFLGDAEKVKDIKKYAANKEYGIDGMVLSKDISGGDQYSFLRVSRFESSLIPDWDDSIQVYFHGVLLPYSMMPEYNKYYGRCDELNNDEVIITTAMVKQVAFRNSLSSLTDPEALLGFKLNIDDGLYYVVGVIESDEPSMYVAEESYARKKLNYYGNEVIFNIRREIEQGKVEIINNRPEKDIDSVREGDKIVINGVELTVNSFTDAYYSYDSWLEKHNQTIKETMEDYCGKNNKTVYDYLDYYFEEYLEYLAYCNENRDRIYFDHCMELALEGNMYAILYLESFCSGYNDYYYAKMFYMDNNRFPNEEELLFCRETYSDVEQVLQYVEDIDLEARYNSVVYLLSEEDYKLIAGSFGTTKGYGLIEDVKPKAYVILHSSNPKETDKFVEKFFTEHDADSFSYMSPLKELKEERKRIVNDNIFSIALWLMMAIAVIMFTFMIISSNLLKQKKEYGIYRCLGVSKANLKLRFCVENMATSILTSGIGSLLVGGGLVLISKSRYAMAFKEIFWYPTIMVILIPAFFVLLSVFASWISMSVFLRHNPGDIMSELES